MNLKRVRRDQKAREAELAARKHQPERKGTRIVASRDDGNHIGRTWVLLEGEADVRTG